MANLENHTAIFPGVSLMVKPNINFEFPAENVLVKVVVVFAVRISHLNVKNIAK